MLIGSIQTNPVFLKRYMLKKHKLLLPEKGEKAKGQNSKEQVESCCSEKYFLI